VSGFVVRQADVELFGNADGTERFKTTLVSPLVPIDALRAGWYRLAAGASNPPDVHQVDEIYFITAGSAEIDLDGRRERLVGGDTVLVPAGCHHQLFNDSDKELELVFLFSPPPAPRGPGDPPSAYGPLNPPR
jgi:mannose-6-phosphate isomerase-like protein (cupin superfamily)